VQGAFCAEQAWLFPTRQQKNTINTTPYGFPLEPVPFLFFGITVQPPVCVQRTGRWLNPTQAKPTP